jgi:uncharacterized protein YdaU (DUF1376 family)
LEWYAWYWSDYESDTLHLTLEQDAIYRRLIDWYSSRQKAIPDNDTAIATICRISPEKWLDNAVVIRNFFTQKNGRLHLKRCDAQIEHQRQMAAGRSSRAKRAAKVRWGKEEENHGDECYEHAPSMRDAMLADATDLTNQTNKTYKTNKQAAAHQNSSAVNGHGFFSMGGLDGGFMPSLETADQLLSVAPGWDQHYLVGMYNSWQKGQERPRSPDKAFLGWVRSFTKGRPPP